VNVEQYDTLVLVSGEAGNFIAWHLANSGTANPMIERQYVGGSCPSIACLPSKNIIHSAKFVSYSAEVTSLELPKTTGVSRCRACGITSARWSMRSSKFIWIVIVPAERNSTWEAGASLRQGRLKPSSLTVEIA
jgi:hypothetical protein